MIKTKIPKFEDEMKKVKGVTNPNEYVEAVIKMTDLMTNLIGAQRETIKLISTIGRMTMKMSEQLDTMANIAITKDQIIKPKRHSKQNKDEDTTK